MTALATGNPRFARFLPAVAVLMIGCAWLAAAATRGDREESLTLAGERFAHTYTYDVTPGTLSIEVELEATVAAGTLRARAIDPTGKERMSLRLESGSGRGSTGRVEALPGRWRLEVSTDDARGHALTRFTTR